MLLKNLIGVVLGASMVSRASMLNEYGWQEGWYPRLRWNASDEVNHSLSWVMAASRQGYIIVDEWVLMKIVAALEAARSSSCG